MNITGNIWLVRSRSCLWDFGDKFQSFKVYFFSDLSSVERIKCNFPTLFPFSIHINVSALKSFIFTYFHFTLSYWETWQLIPNSTSLHLYASILTLFRWGLFCFKKPNIWSCVSFQKSFPFLDKTSCWNEFVKVVRLRSAHLPSYLGAR